MAGEWIAMGSDLWTSPELVRLSAFCQQAVSACQTRESAKCCAVGALYRFWSIVDVHCEDGFLAGYSESDIDYEVGLSGWCHAMKSVGWLTASPQGLAVPGFEKWFSRSAKRRRMNAIYQADSRSRRQQTVSTTADKMLTTVQKRTIQNKKKKTPLPPSIPDALNTPEFCAAWDSWQQHRREINHPLKPEQARKQLAQFVAWGIARSIAAIDHTITKGWQGIREPDFDKGNGKPKTQGRANAALEAMRHADSK